MKRIKIENKDGVKKWAWVLRSKSNLWVHFEGKTYEYIEQKSSRGRSQSVIKKNEILSPMPGKILEVKVKVGESVKAGSVLVVMEAMKMEYSLEIGVTGVVETLSCKVGDQVTKDQLLVKVS